MDSKEKQKIWEQWTKQGLKFEDKTFQFY